MNIERLYLEYLERYELEHDDILEPDAEEPEPPMTLLEFKDAYYEANSEGRY